MSSEAAARITEHADSSVSASSGHTRLSSASCNADSTWRTSLLEKQVHFLMRRLSSIESSLLRMVKGFRPDTPGQVIMKDVKDLLRTHADEMKQLSSKLPSISSTPASPAPMADYTAAEPVMLSALRDDQKPVELAQPPSIPHQDVNGMEGFLAIRDKYWQERITSELQLQRERLEAAYQKNVKKKIQRQCSRSADQSSDVLTRRNKELEVQVSYLLDQQKSTNEEIGSLREEVLAGKKIIADFAQLMKDKANSSV